ncbi:hypothetical protein HOLleu_22436 [Holothuria leucospilota]|uniref:Ig-like domain-containing protein n=1 Tax=Holothuria leucospilota TaxID=206669 RepID=A0A9Q1BZ93_HOLLE|nr:hypothetical protein HOLleu_22436 [Holothuria leucospilota]
MTTGENKLYEVDEIVQTKTATKHSERGEDVMINGKESTSPHHTMWFQVSLKCMDYVIEIPDLKEKKVYKPSYQRDAVLSKAKNSVMSIVTLNRRPSTTFSKFTENLSKVLKHEENETEGVTGEVEAPPLEKCLFCKRCFEHFYSRQEEEILAGPFLCLFSQNIKIKTTDLKMFFEGFKQSENEKVILQEIFGFQRCFEHFYSRQEEEILAGPFLRLFSQNIKIKTTALQIFFEGFIQSENEKVILQEIFGFKRCFQHFYSRQEEERLAELFLHQFSYITKIKETALQMLFEGFIKSENEKAILQEIFGLKKIHLLHNQKGGPTASDKAKGVNTEEGEKDSEATFEKKGISDTEPEQNRNFREATRSNTLAKEGKRLTGLKSAFRNVKKAEKIKWWAYNLALTFTLSQMTMLCMTITLMAQIASASFSCAENQTAELGERVIIACTFPDSFHAVYWYDDVRDGSSPLTTYTHHREDKTEFCMENEDFDVSENGSLIICNVAVWHEKTYTVTMFTNPNFFEKLTVSVKVIAFPGNRSTTVQCENCHKGRYHRIDTNGSLSCSFKVARPAVVIEWVQRYPQGDSLISTQEVNITNNANGTYNTKADVHVVAKIDKQIAVFVCKATYTSSGWKREREILLDFSHGVAFPSEPISTTYMETRKRAELRCGGSDHIIRIWKLVQTTGDSETIGFRFGDSTEMTKNISVIEITSEGSLIFSSPQIQHEGEYVCVYSDGIKDGLQKTAVVVLIAPSPPYIRITGCNDAEYNCVLKEEKIQELTCTVDGVYPNATLEWVPKNPSQISFYNYSTLYEKNGLTYDISASVKLVVSPDLHCEDEIYIECRLHGPASRVMKAERSARLTPKTCMAKTDDRDDQLTILVQLHVLEMLVVVLYAITITYFVIHRRNHRGMCNSTKQTGSIQTNTNGQTSRKGTKLVNGIRSPGTKMEKGIKSQDAGGTFALTRSQYRQTMEQDVLLQEDENTLALSI